MQSKDMSTRDLAKVQKFDLLLSAMKNLKAIFLDRDGVVNEDKHYVFKIDDFEFKKGLFDLCRYLIELDYLIVIITNQSGISRGYFTEADFHLLNDWMLIEFNSNGVDISEVYYCPHLPEDNCNCRKPATGLVMTAAEKLKINLAQSWVIGDKDSDIELGVNAKIGGKILLQSEYVIPTRTIYADYVVNDLVEIKEIILN